MNILSEKDLNTSRKLNGIPLNNRDASMGSMGRGEGIWTKPATQIQTPANSNRNPSWSPFTANRFTNNLNRSTHHRETNHTRSATLIPPGPPKRSKRMHPTFEEDAPYMPANLKKQRTDELKVAPDVINIEDDEDLGVPVGVTVQEGSGDELDVIPLQSTGNGAAKPVSEWRYSLKASEERPLLSGPSSPIENADDIVESLKPSGTVVGKMVKHYENKNTEKSIPHVDLKNKMKRKGGHRVQSTLEFESHITPQNSHQDPIATSTTAFRRGGKGKQRETIYDGEFCLPLKEWCLGYLHFQEPAKLYFSWGSQEIRVEGPSYVECLPATLIKSVEAYQWPDDFDFTRGLPSVEILTLASRKGKFGSNFSEHFQSGENGKGFVTFKLDAGDDSWSETFWRNFVDFLRSSVQGHKGGFREVIGRSAVHVLWQKAEQRFTASFAEGSCVELPNTAGTSSKMAAGTKNLSSTVTAKAGQTSKPSSSGEERRSTSTNPPKFAKRQQTPFRQVDEPAEPGDRASGLRRSSRNGAQAKRKTPVEDPEEVILSYPPFTTGAVNITNGDLSRLQPNEYLNDTVIEFGLKLWHKELEQSNATLAEQVHIFNSFFYKKLNKKNVEESYKTVARWTNKIDLFKKKYVIVPINEAMHWYLAIIYQPEYVLLPPEEKTPPATRGRTRLSQAKNVSDNDHDMEGPKTREGTADGLVDDKSEENTVTSTSDTAVGIEGVAEPPTEPQANEDDEADMNIVASASATVDDTSDTENTFAYMECDDDEDSAASVMGHLTQPDTSVTGDAGDDVTMADAGEQETMADAGEQETKDEQQSSVATISPQEFYAKPPSGKGKKRASEPPAPMSEEAAEQSSTAKTLKPIPYIFIMDSLGQRHTKAVGTLASYLKFEAVDKQKKEPTNITKAVGKHAQVPLQPNFSDCGVYLLHFARTFIEKTEYLADIISRDRPTRATQAERQTDWDARNVEGYREHLTDRIKELSAEWKKDRAARAAEEELEKKKKEAIEIQDSSDSDDMEIVDEKPASAKKKKGGKTYGKQNSSRPSRMRG
ncbi:hypothetical protein V5O48_006670 [Marasmius crinis-equi]|uniref:Ubiquitin-like protease family profile domain-containing protein n=1 Tax=Marasmius crinis-equi TaxID=585013 RepID=A0ABR3FJD9_9AGAR